MRTALLLVCLSGLALASCGGQSTSIPAPTSSPTPIVVPPPSPQPGPSLPVTWDLEANGVPRFIATDYIDLAVIAQISRFRSSAGHSYTDDFETCRSMKHYFMPRSGLDWSTVAITSPVSGTIVRTRADSFGTQIAIQPSEYPAFTVILFHVSPRIATAEGTALEAGQQIGTHVGTQTYSDVAVGVETPRGYALVSWFDAVTDGLLARYQARGLTARGDLVVPRAQRDAAPLTCDGETFTGRDALSVWMMLR